MKTNDIIKEIEKLNVSEKLTIVQGIWDSIALSNSELPLPEWQKNELDKRYKEYRNGNTPLYEWKEVHDQLRNKER